MGEEKSRVPNLVFYILILIFSLGGSIFVWFIISWLAAWFGSDFNSFEYLMFSLPGGIVSAFCGNWLNKKYIKSTLGTIGLLLGILILSIVLSVFSVVGFVQLLLF